MKDPEAFERLLDFARTLPDLDVAVVRDAMSVRRFHRDVQTMFEQQLELRGLSLNRVAVLEALLHSPRSALTPAELAEAAQVTRGAMTGLLDSLEKEGRIERSPHPSDRRMICVALTPAGRSFIQAFLAQDYERAARIIGRLTEAERAQMLDFYARIFRAFQEELKVMEKEATE